jgi:hypothetical protein
VEVERVVSTSAEQRRRLQEVAACGYDRMPGSEPGDAISGRLYTNHGDTLTYVCEVEGDTMTI